MANDASRRPSVSMTRLSAQLILLLFAVALGSHAHLSLRRLTERGSLVGSLDAVSERVSECMHQDLSHRFGPLMVENRALVLAFYQRWRFAQFLG